MEQECAPYEKIKGIAVLFMDMQGSTTAWALKAPLTCQAVLHLKKLAAELSKKHSGAVENFTGDGYMVSFGGEAEAVLNAVAFAATLQQQWQHWREEHLTGTRLETKLRLRMGLHYGWAWRLTSEEKELVGPTVNEAQRLESNCDAQNELCLLSSATLDRFEDKDNLVLGDQRDYQPKGKEYVGKDGSKQATEQATPLLAFTSSAQPAQVASMVVGQEENQKLLEVEKAFQEGYELDDLARVTEDLTEKKRLFVAACEKYKQAVAIQMDDYRVWNNWGTVLDGLARATEDITEKKHLFVEACEKYKQAVKIQPDGYEAWNNWGAALDGLARATEDITEKKRLFVEACEKHQRAVKIQPDKYGAWHNWDVALIGLAKITEDKNKRRRLLKEAKEKFEKARRLKPD